MKYKFNDILRYLPPLATLPEGYAVGLAIHGELGWHISIVVIASVIVAGTGFWGVQVMNAMNEFNATLFQDERKLKITLPTWKAGMVLAVWFTGVTLLTVFLDAWPVLRDWTPLGLVVIGFSAANLFSLSNLTETRREERMAYRQHKAKEKEHSRNQLAIERKQRKEQAQMLAMKRQEITQRLQGKGPRKIVKSGSKLSDELLLFKWAQDPYLTPTAMAESLYDGGKGITVTRQAVSQRLDKMIKLGLVVRESDGRVVEVISSGAGESVGAAQTGAES